MAYDDTDDNQRRDRSKLIGAILALEATQPRVVREYLLGDATALTRLQAIEAQIVALRAALVKNGF